MTRYEIEIMKKENAKLKKKVSALNNKKDLSKDLEKKQEELNLLKEKLSRIEGEKNELEEQVRSKHELKENLGIDDIIELPTQSYTEITRLNNIISEAQNTINNILSTIIAVYQIDTESYNLEFTPDNKALIIKEIE